MTPVADKQAITEVVQSWALYRDTGLGRTARHRARRCHHDGDLV